jgi:ADP-ribose pyrophosphatase
MMDRTDKRERPYKVTHSESHTIGRFTVVQDTIVIADKEYPYSYLVEREGVCVMAVYNGTVVYIKQYRHSVNDWKLEFPCGALEDGEIPADAARRELLEETGYIADTLIPLGNQVMRAGVSNGKIYMFLAVCKEKRQAEPEPTELIQILSEPIAEFEKQVDSGEFEQLLGLVCWYKGKKRLEEGV